MVVIHIVLQRRLERKVLFGGERRLAIFFVRRRGDDES